MSERSILDAVKVQSRVVIPIVKALERTQTRMQGASHCDFRWRKR